MEIDPPHGHAAEEGGEKGAGTEQRPVLMGEGCACDQNRFAERDDDEEGAPLGHVPAFDIPVLSARAAEAGDPEIGPWASELEHHAGRPESEADLRLGEPTGNPEHADRKVPAGD